MTLKVKYHDFTLHTRSRTLAHAVRDADALRAAAHLLLHDPAPPSRPVRLLGLSVSSLTPAGLSPGRQLTFEF